MNNIRRATRDGFLGFPIQQAPKSNEYYQEAYCENCGGSIGFLIKKGTITKEVLKPLRCPYCKCKGVLK